VPCTRFVDDTLIAGRRMTRPDAPRQLDGCKRAHLESSACLIILAQMCGRFTQHCLARTLRARSPHLPASEYPPTTMIDVVVSHEAGRDLLSMRWGVIPSRWKKTAKECHRPSAPRAEKVRNHVTRPQPCALRSVAPQSPRISDAPDRAGRSYRCLHAHAQPRHAHILGAARHAHALRAKVTPEMLSYFSEQLAGNASRGLINRVTDVKLLQGDLAEAWREGDTDYATVAMKFALKDSMVERASGRTVEGGERSEVTELWTFMRACGGNWLLSAIQQT
jgi:Tim44-like domain